MDTSFVRPAAVAGRFYPANPDDLTTEVGRYTAPAAHARRVRAVVAPHAGYVYSGRVAGDVYRHVVVPDVAVVLCPNHTGLGDSRATILRGAFALPTGSVPIAADAARAIADAAGLVDDARAHGREHALEVQLPFLAARNGAVQLVPICLGPLSLDACVAMGEALAGVDVVRSGAALLVASTDMSHYLPVEAARAKDALAIERMVALDPEGLYETVVERDISMCGLVPTTVVLAAARALGGSGAELVRYATSGEAFGDYDRVVGYAGLIIP